MTPLERFGEHERLVFHVYHTEFSSHSHEREDIISEGRLALWKACHNFDESLQIQFSTYAVTAIRNAIRRYLNRIRKHSTVLSLDEKISEDNDGCMLCLIDTVVREEDPTARYLIQACIGQLDERDQRVIQLLLEGYTQQEISTRLSISQSTVHRCLWKFKTLIEKEMENGISDY
jgi:RNA polymerase sigma factor (sigma-70 family)